MSIALTVDGRWKITIPPHDMLSPHTYAGGKALDVIGLSAANTLGILTPDSDVYDESAEKLLKADSDGGLRLDHLELGSVGGAGVGGLYQSGNHDYQGDLKPYRNAVTYTGYVFVPLTTSRVATDWDGDAKADASDGVINLQAAAPAGFALPVEIKAIAFSLYVKAATVGLSCAIATSGSVYGVQVYAVVANQWNCGGGVVACDANGDVYFTALGDLTGVILNILGYWI